MEKSLTAAERAVLQTWIEVGSAPKRRRARIILLRDQGRPTDAIAEEVGLSRRQVRHWLAAFREQRMGIFPPLELDGGDDADAPDEEQPLPALNVEDLLELYGADVARADHVSRLAVRLFDLTADLHALSAERRPVLGAAAALHDVGRELDPSRRHLVGRDLLVAQPVAGFDRTEQDVIAVLVAFHRKKVRRKREPLFQQLPDAAQGDTLALAALLRVAVALDASKSQSTTVERVEVGENGVTIVVAGPQATRDAAAAQRRRRLWRKRFDRELGVATEEQLAQISRVVKLAEGQVPLPELESPGLLPDDPMSEAGRKTLWFHFLRMLKHEPGTRAGQDIEELHDMRVATRRMRAAIRVFGDFFEPQVIKPFNKGVRRVTRALGAVRDLDVFEEKAGHYLETLPETSRGSLDPLLEKWHEERESARREMLDFFDSSRYRKFKREFAEFLQAEGEGARVIPRGEPVPHQVRHVAPRLIYTRYETVRAYETVLDDAPVETLHALRIDCKYLRYTLEFLREVLGSEAEAVIKEVKTMQDHLGDLNDAEVAIGLLSEFLTDWDVSQIAVPLSRRRSAEGVVTYMAARHAEKHRLMTSFPEAWARLNRAEVRRWLALSVAAL